MLTKKYLLLITAAVCSFSTLPCAANGSDGERGKSTVDWGEDGCHGGNADPKKGGRGGHGGHGGHGWLGGGNGGNGGTGYGGGDGGHGGNGGCGGLRGGRGGNGGDSE